jgi:SpoIID/LytB domain protein
VFVLTGGGWGHGVGMSQWGALGQAEQGRGYREILATYYPGTRLTGTGSREVRVALASQTPRAVVSSAGPLAVTDAAGARYSVPGGRLDLTPALRARIGKQRSPVALRPPVIVRPGAGNLLAYGGTEVRGELRILKGPGGSLVVVNALGLEEYLAGVVAREMPSDWPLEALKAQAVAARTYTVVSLELGRTKQWDVYTDTRSQVYAGVSGEQPATSAAVNATAGEILTFGGALAQTPYFSSSGGRTRSSLDVFGYDAPYLRAVDDPWDARSPNHAWSPKSLTPRRLAAALGLRSPVEDAILMPAVAGPPGERGKPERVRFRLANGSSVELEVQEIRTRMNLLSTGFELGQLMLDPPSRGAPRGSPVRLQGIARHESAELERRAEDGRWVRVAPLEPDSSGRFAVVVRPMATTAYRLAAAGVAGPAVTLRVSAAAATG